MSRRLWRATIGRALEWLLVAGEERHGDDLMAIAQAVGYGPRVPRAR